MATPLQEALTAVGASALIQKRIDPLLLEYQRRYAPVVAALPTVKWDSTVYYFNNRSQLPVGGFVTDGGANAVSTSVYNQNLYPIKLLQTVGAVTGYAQAVTADLIGNLRAREIEGANRGMYWDIENALMWGNASSTVNGPAPQFDGFDSLLTTFSGDSTNAIDFGGNAFDLGTLDQVIDLVESNVAETVESSDWCFVVSPTANTRVSQLLLNQQRFIDTVEVASGLIVPSYRNIPFVKTSFLSPRTSVMGAITLAGANTGGALLTTTYYYRVTAIIGRFGEIQACPEVSVTIGGSNAGVATISFTPPTGFEAGGPISYKVFRSTTAGAETLLGYVDSQILTSTGTVVQTNQIVDNGSALIPQNSVGPTQPGTLPTSYFGTNTGIHPLDAGAQNLYLVSRNPNYLVRPYVREMLPVDLYPTTASPDSLPYALVTDTCLALRAPKYAGRVTNFTVVLSN